VGNKHLLGTGCILGDVEMENKLKEDLERQTHKALDVCLVEEAY